MQDCGKVGSNRGWQHWTVNSPHELSSVKRYAVIFICLAVFLLSAQVKLSLYDFKSTTANPNSVLKLWLDGEISKQVGTVFPALICLAALWFLPPLLETKLGPVPRRPEANPRHGALLALGWFLRPPPVLFSSRLSLQ